MKSLLRRWMRETGRSMVRSYAVREGVTVGRGVHIGPGTILSSFSQLVVGDGTYIGKGCTIQVSGRIGRGTLIANRVGIVGKSDHDLRAIGVPMSYAPWIGAEANFRGTDVVDIGEDVWIGYGAVVISGVAVGRGAVIGAGAVVTRDIPAYVIAAGNPAKPIGMRFAPGQVREHELRVDQFWRDWNGRLPAGLV